MEKLMTIEELEQIAERSAGGEGKISARVECLRGRGMPVSAQRCHQIGAGEGSAAHRSELPGARNRLHGALFRGTAGEQRARWTPAEERGGIGCGGDCCRLWIGAMPERLLCSREQPFFQRQTAIVLENSGRIDPEKIEEYIAADGYQALVQALTEMAPRADCAGSFKERAARARRRRLSHGSEVGHGGQRRLGPRSMSSAMPTRAIPGRSWIAACWRAIRIACWRG